MTAPLYPATYSESPAAFAHRQECHKHDHEAEQTREYTTPHQITDESWGWAFHVVRTNLRGLKYQASQEYADGFWTRPYTPEQRQMFLDVAAAIEGTLAIWNQQQQESGESVP